MGSRVNSSTIFASGTTASAYSTTLGVAALAGDLIVVAMESNGTHATNGMSVQDSVNLVNFTTILEEQGSNASSRWLQAFVYQTPVDLASGTSITATPYAANTASSFSADIFRGYTATQDKTATGGNSPLGTTATSPAFASAPTAGSLVVSFVGSPTSSVSIASPHTQGSSGTTDVATGNGYVLSADGASTYAGVWTLGTSVSWAAIGGAFTASGGGVTQAPNLRRGLTGQRFYAKGQQHPYLSADPLILPGPVIGPATPGRAWREHYNKGLDHGFLIATPTPAQINPDLPWQQRRVRTWMLAIARRRSAPPVPEQGQLTDRDNRRAPRFYTPSRRTRTNLPFVASELPPPRSVRRAQPWIRRSRRFDPPFAEPPVPVNPDLVEWWRRHAAPRFWQRRGHIILPPWPQVVVTNPAFVEFIRRHPSPKLWLRRQKQVGPPLPSGEQPQGGPHRSAPRPLIRRGHLVLPPWAQVILVNPAFVEFGRRHAPPRFWRRRGRLAEPGWGQAIQPPPALGVIPFNLVTRAMVRLIWTRAMEAVSDTRSMSITLRTRDMNISITTRNEGYGGYYGEVLYGTGGLYGGGPTVPIKSR